MTGPAGEPSGCAHKPAQSQKGHSSPCEGEGCQARTANGRGHTQPSLDRVHGCLVGLAVGDALGRPTVGLGRHEIRARWGRVADFLPDEDTGAGRFSANTQAAVVLCQAIVAKRGFDADVTGRALAAWCAGPDARGPARGMTEACERLGRGMPWQEAASDATDCSPGVRAAPVGLLHCRNPDRLAQDAATSGLITHRDPRSVAAAAAVAAAVAHLACASAFELRPYLDRAAAAAAAHNREMAAIIRGIAALLDLPPRLAIDELGYSAFALEAIPAAIYCFAAAPDDFAECVLLAVNTGGDAAAIAAIAGALSGAYLGLAGIPPRWAQGVEESQLLGQLARELHALA